MIWDLGARSCLRRSGLPGVTDHKGHDEIGPSRFQADGGGGLGPGRGWGWKALLGTSTGLLLTEAGGKVVTHDPVGGGSPPWWLILSWYTTREILKGFKL